MSQQLPENKAYLGLGLGLCFGEGLGLGFSKGLGLGLGLGMLAKWTIQRRHAPGPLRL